MIWFYIIGYYILVWLTLLLAIKIDKPDLGDENVIDFIKHVWLLFLIPFVGFIVAFILLCISIYHRLVFNNFNFNFNNFIDWLFLNKNK